MNFKQSLIESELFSKELNSKIKECGGEGHKEPDTTNNYCHYCHRHLKYEAPEADKIRKNIQDNSLYPQFCDESLIKRLETAEIESQKRFDFDNGLLVLKQEYIDSTKFCDGFFTHRGRDIIPRVNQYS